MSFIGRDLARRLGIWALLQALPGEAELKSYLRAAYLGVATVIVASVLTGAALAAGLVVAYRLLLEQGWQPWQAGGLALCVGVAIILGCVALAGHWFSRLAEVKHRTAMFNDVGRDVLSGAFNTLVQGFLEGMEDSREENTLREAWREAKRTRSTKSEKTKP